MKLHKKIKSFTSNTNQKNVNFDSNNENQKQKFNSILKKYKKYDNNHFSSYNKSSRVANIPSQRKKILGNLQKGVIQFN